MPNKADYEYFASLNDQQVLKTLSGIQNKMVGLEKRGNKSFSGIGKAAGAMGSILTGVVSGAVTALTSAFIHMAKNAIKGLQEIGKESVKLAKEQLKVEGQTEAVIASTGGVAGMSVEAVKSLASEMQSITNFGDEAVLTGENLLLTFTNIGSDIFPKATMTMLDMSEALGQDMKSSAIQLGKALNDPITGVTALRRVGVQFTESQEDYIKSLAKSGQLGKAQAVILQELQKEFGGSAEAARAADGGVIAFNNALGDLKENAGIGYLSQLGSTFEDLADITGSSEMQELATAMGVLVGVVTDLAKTQFFDLFDIDNAKIGELADDINGLASAFASISDTDLDLKLGTLFDAMSALLKVFTLAILSMKYFTQGLGESGAYMEWLSDLIITALGPLGSFIKGFEKLNEIIVSATGEDINVNLDDLIASYEEALGIVEFDLNEIRNETNKPIVAPPIDSDEMVDSAEEMSDEVEKALEKVADIEKDFNRDVEDAYTKHARAMADLDEDIAQKRVDEAKDNARAIEDIYRKQTDALEDEAKDWSREQADIARKQLRERGDLEKEAAKDRIQVELDYQKQIKDINRQFQYDLLDAEENQDALAYIAAVKKRERAVEEAKTERTETQSEVEKQIEERQATLAEQQQRELEDAKLGHERALEDLQIRLDRELEAQAIKHEREMADIVVFEERKRAELQNSLERDIEDAKEAHDRKLDDLKESLDAEVLAQVEAELAKTAAARAGADERIAIAQEEAAARAAAGVMDYEAGGTDNFSSHFAPPSSTGSSSLPSSLADYRGFASGGVASGLSFVGENGMELLNAGSASRVIPNHEIGSYLGGMVGGAVTNNNMSVSNSLYNPATLTPEQMMMTEQIATRMSVNVFNRMIGGK